MRFYSLQLCLFLGMFFTLNILAQIEVTGQLVDDYTNAPIDGAKIKVKGMNAGAFTDDKGAFKISIQGELPIVLISSYLGYSELETIVNSADAPISIRLKTDKTLNLEEVKVRSFATDKEKESALSIETMSLAEIQETPSTDFYEGLSHMKGVDLTSASLGFKVVNTRGFNSTSPVRTLQIIDGVDNASPGLNFALGNFLGASELDLMKVEIVSGASSAFYGPNAFNGVISMYTKSPFKFQGFSASVKGGERMLNEYAVRYAKAYQNKAGEDKFAFKLNFSYLSANDWVADNANAVQGLDTDENNPGGYDAVNRYGDENLSPNINNALDLQSRWMTPGLRRWHRTGYWEKDIVDYDTKNLKASAALHYLFTEDLELIMASNLGTGTTVYQGDNRFSLKDILFIQNRLELRKKDDFFIRAYATNEDAGNSYDAVLTAFLMQDAASDDWDWYNRYRGYWTSNITDQVRDLDPNLVWEPQLGSTLDIGAIDSVVAAHPDQMAAWHDEAEDYANLEHGDLGGALAYFEPGTARFDSLLSDITSKTSFLEGGSRLQDKSALYHIHGEKIFNTEFAKFTVGANGRLYTPKSDGALFSDTNGVNITNKEFGVYGGLEKRFNDDEWIVKASMRIDKNENFNYLPSPAASVIWQPNKEHSLRATITSAIRNPTLLNQYMYYNVGRAKLVGNIAGYDSLVTIESLRDYYYTQNPDTLSYFNLDPIAPEKVKSIEIGYRGVLWNKLYVDMNYYFNSYTNFIGYVTGADIKILQNGPYIKDVYRIATNSKENITTQGATIGLNYYLGDHYAVNGNYSWNVLNKQSDDPIIPAYNTPEHKFNIGFRGRDISIKKFNGFGFNVNYKWIEGFIYEGSPQFTGSVPTYGLLDAQINKRIEKANLTVKIGASNLLNNQVLQVYGGPFVGRMIYTSISFDWKDKAKK
ncbi:MAG: TonB-dependent receptor [Crocinitomicaceae bacterium]|nr:TonB-dependent receptor [Crocinitomicaceae bacterium]MDG1734360.1 TonB-dependent receptor [Crocinitomicaceae bacterium]